MTTKVITPPFRMSFPTLPPMPAKKDEQTGRETYPLVMLFPPGTDLEPFRNALKQAVVDKYGPDAKNWPKIKRKASDVLLDFDAYNQDVKRPLPGDWAGWTKINATGSVKMPPDVYHNGRTADGSLLKVTNPAEIYGGRWARAVLNAYFYDTKTGNGVTFGLNSVQLLKHDTSFGGRSNAAVDFADDDIPAAFRDMEGPAVGGIEPVSAAAAQEAGW